MTSARTVLVATLVAAYFAVPAHATTSDPRYDAVSSTIAGRGPAHPTHVLCYERDEAGDPEVIGAWGYVWLDNLTDINIAAEPCEGLRGIVSHDATVPLWEQALGALVLAHESYHQNVHLFANTRDSEAKTECRAIRAFHATVRLLGGDDALAAQLYPYAAAFHFRIEYRFPQYGMMDCRLPWWWE